MTNRILDFSDRPVRLNVRNSLLVVRSPETDRNGPDAPRATSRPEKIYRCERLHESGGVTIPLADIAVVIASHPQISFSHAVLSGLASNGGVFVACNEKRLPIAMLLPLATHHLQAERFAAQAAMPLPTKKRIWKQIVKAKIMAQARLLVERTGGDRGLQALASRVRSGDPENVEAQAARIYWPALFGAPEFRRDTEGDGLNACLNYGYAIVRSITARAICAAGLHPCLGVHHHNRYDAFCLADDLMEPFRPIADRTAAALAGARGQDAEFEKEAKKNVLESLSGRFLASGESRTLFDWMGRSASSLVGVIEGSCNRLDLPALEPGSTPS